MTRAALKYDRRPIDPNRVWEGFDVETPTAGTYRMRMRRDGPPCAVRVWFGAPIDPETGEALTETRGARWQAALNGAPVELDKVWPGCARDPIFHEQLNKLIDDARAVNSTPLFPSLTQSNGERAGLESCPPPAIREAA